MIRPALARRLRDRPLFGGGALLGVLAMIGLMARAVDAASPPLPSTIVPSRPPAAAAPPPAAPAAPEAEADIEITIPNDAPQSGNRAIDTLTFQVKDVVVEGAEHFDKTLIDAETKPLVGTEITLKKVDEVAAKIEGLYRQAGYFLTVVLVPAQRIDEGVVKIQVVEGYIKRVIVEGGSDAVSKLIKGYLADAVVARPTRLDQVERGILLAQDLPGVSAVGVLRPADDPGSAELLVTVADKPIEASVSITNRNSAFTGPFSAYGEASYAGLFELGERVSVGLSVTPDLKENRYFVTRWEQPIGPDGFLFGADASYSNGQPGADLKPRDIRTEAVATNLHLAYPLVRTRSRTIIAEAGGGFSDSKITELGAPFSHDTYESVEARLRFSDSNFLGAPTFLQAGIRQGVPLPGSTRSGDPLATRHGADPWFTRLTFDVARVESLPENFSLSLDATGQYGLNQLFAGEELGFGGGRIGRGYDPSEITGRSGVGAALELRYDVPYQDDIISGIQMYTFFDAAKVSHASGGAVNYSLSSAGTGARLRLTPGLSSTLEFAQPLTSLDTSSHARQKSSRVFVDLSARF